ncbi:MAG TPA: hydrogenase small subunit [Thermoanaerobaculia bacterium]|nr:hydrogenase small subunit [Thermoanaerobaculia bacterium]
MEPSSSLSSSPITRGRINRRDFIRICSLAAAAVGLPGSSVARLVEAAGQGKKPSVIWLSFQECTGCTESMLRTSHPQLDELILDLISLDYHEALLAPSGHLAEAAKVAAMEAHRGRYILVVEGAIPTKDDGIYCKIGGRTALEIVREAAEGAGAIIAIGSCASFGGIPAADPNPTGAQGAAQVLAGKTVVTLPGCPANPYIFLGTALQYATFGTLPALDEQGRPKFAYGRTIHEHCPRRPHFDAGRFALSFGDSGHREGWCLYQLGCKGPQTHASCSVLHFNEVVNAWPIGNGHPCFGCTEAKIAFRVPLHATAEIERPTPPDTYPAIAPEREGVSPVATGAAGLIGGALLGAGLMASRKLGEAEGPKEEGARP